MKKKLALVLAAILLVTGCGSVTLKDGGEAVTTFKEGGISSDTLYSALKEKYGIETLVSLIDTDLLEREFDTTKEEKEYINNYIKSIKATVKENEYDLESYIKYYYDVDSLDALEDYFRLNYRRNQWFIKYAKDSVSEKEIKTYYEDMTIGDINLSWILVQVGATSEDETDVKTEKENKALSTAKEAINELKNGESFENVAKKYSDDSATVNKGGLVGDVNRGMIEDNLIEEAIKLEVGKYSKTPIKTEQGYAILYVNSKKDKPTLEDSKDKIVETIANEKTAKDNGSLYIESLESLRSKYEMTFKDSELSSDYTEYMNNLKKQNNAK